MVPVIAYEDLGPYEALKHSAKLMREKWGESIGANFSIGLVMLPFFLVIAIAAMAISELASEQAGIALFVCAGTSLVILSGALHSIFIAILYRQVKGGATGNFDQRMLDNLFIGK